MVVVNAWQRQPLMCRGSKHASENPDKKWSISEGAPKGPGRLINAALGCATSLCSIVFMGCWAKSPPANAHTFQLLCRCSRRATANLRRRASSNGKVTFPTLPDWTNSQDPLLATMPKEQPQITLLSEHEVRPSGGSASYLEHQLRIPTEAPRRPPSKA